jgi:hypothetical protein
LESRWNIGGVERKALSTSVDCIEPKLGELSALGSSFSDSEDRMLFSERDELREEVPEEWIEE